MFWYILLQNTCVWLQWLGFGGKHSILCIRGFNYQALIRNLLVFQQSPTNSYQIDVFYKHYVHIFGKFHHFPYKSGSGATLLRVFGEILLISPQIICFMYYICVLLNHCIKLKFYACCMFALANYVFCGIFIPKCQIPCYMQCPAFMFNNICVLLQRTPIWFVWSIFESNILLFCSQPHIITCIMYFVGVQI